MSWLVFAWTRSTGGCKEVVLGKTEHVTVVSEVLTLDEQ
jgi:hypothetical protein